jgi:hypothetical protein
MLTDNQKANIQHLDAQTCMELMHICADRVGLVDIDEAQEALGLKKRAVYNRMKCGKLRKFQIGKHVYPCINS